LSASAAVSAPVSLCRAGAKAKAWKAECEGMKSSLTWALCDEAPYRLRILDLTLGTLSQGGINRRIGLCDADGDGRIRLDGGDRLVVDWDGDGMMQKSLEADGITGPGGNALLRFSLDSTTFELVSADENGAWLTCAAWALSTRRRRPSRPRKEAARPRTCGS